MKCENCGKNEVTFIYQSNINGKITEKHLCSQCAEELGIARQITARSRQIHDRFRRSVFGDSFMNDFFSPMPALFGRMDHLLEDPFEDLFDQMPVLGAGTKAAEPEKKEDALVNKEEQSRFAYLRQLNALRMEQKKAVRQENFERAAELRDEIRKLEAERSQQL